MGIRALETSPSRSYSRCLRPEKKSRDQPSLAKLVKNHEATLKLLMDSLAARRDTELDGWAVSLHDEILSWMDGEDSPNDRRSTVGWTIRPLLDPHMVPLLPMLESTLLSRVPPSRFDQQ